MRKLLLCISLLFITSPVVNLSASELSEQEELNLTALDSANIREETTVSAEFFEKVYHVTTDPGATLTTDYSDVDSTVPGTYQIVFTETMEDGRSMSVTSECVITDVLPDIKFKQQNVQAVGNKNPNSYDLESLFGATATELTDGDLTTQMTIDASQVVYDQVGHNSVYFTVSDNEGNQVTEVGDLYFRSLAPTVTGRESQSSTIGQELTDQQLIDLFEIEVTAADGDVVIAVDDSQVDYQQLGTYQLSFTASDSYSVDSEPFYGSLSIVPEEQELELIAKPTASAREGYELSDEDLIARFEVQNDADTVLTVDQSAVDYNRPADYPVTFTETTASGQTMAVTSTLTIYDVLPGFDFEHQYIQAEVNTEIDLITAFGVRASENVTGDLNEQIIVDDSQVDYLHIGHYPVYFTVSDDEGNTVTEAGDLYLRSDAPTITGGVSATVSEGSSLSNDQLVELFGITATDKDGIDYINADTSRIDFSTPGRYSIIFTAYDIYGMNSYEYNGIIEITDVLPTISTDSDEITIEIGSQVDLATAFNITATEVTDGDLTAQVIIDDSQVDYNSVGSYQVQLSVTDNEGNTVTKTVTVTVIDSSTDLGNSCLNNGGHVNNSSNCDQDSTCNNNGNNCDKPNNGNNGNAHKNEDDNHPNNKH